MTINTTRLRKGLLERGYKQADLARASGFMSLGYLSAILCGYVRPSPIALGRLKYGLVKLGFCDSDIDVMLPAVNQSN